MTPARGQAESGISRRHFLQRLTAVGVVGTQAACMGWLIDKEPATSSPNIVWIFSDDHCPDLGFLGTPECRTPNIDQLASEGTYYSQAFTTAPVCSPSRSAMATGMYQTTIGAHNHRSHWEDPVDTEIPLLTSIMREAGYYTVLANDQLDIGSWGKIDWNFKAPDPIYDGTDWRDRSAGQPFFAHVNFIEPHRDFTTAVDEPADPEKVQLPPYYPDHPIARKDWAGYLDAINRLDHKIGLLVERLREDGLLDNTVIMFIGDNGRPFPRGKQFLYDGGIHVPLLIWWPGHVKAGKVDDRLISAIDVTTTVLSLARIPIPPQMQGRAFLGPQAQPPREAIFAARDRCDETVDRIRCVRTHRFKYIRNFFTDRPWTQLNRYKEWHYPILPLMRRLDAEGKLSPEQARFVRDERPAEELYDLREDPYEMHNVAQTSDYADVLKRMRKQLAQWIEETGDQGGIPEDPAFVREMEQLMIDHFEPRPKAWER